MFNYTASAHESRWRRNLNCAWFVLAGLAGALCCPQSADAANWTNVFGGNFSNPGNWDTGVPGSTQAANFGLANTYTVTFDTSPTNTGLQVQNNGNVTFVTNGTNRTYTLTDTATFSPVGSPTLTLGASAATLNLVISRFLEVAVGSRLNVNAGNDVTAGSIQMIQGTIVVDGSGSTLNSGVSGGLTGTVVVGSSGFTSSLTYHNNAAGNFVNTLFIGNDVDSSTPTGTVGTMTVQGGADITTTGAVRIGNVTNGQNGTLTVTGAGSTFVQNGSGALTIGAASGSTALLSVLNGGSYTTGNSAAPTTTINATGTLDITDGTFNANGNIVVDGGTLHRGRPGSVGSGLVWASSRIMTVQNGGHVNFDNDFLGFTLTANTVNVSGAGSQLNVLTNGGLSLGTSSLVNISTGAAANLTALGVGSGSMTVSDSGSILVVTAGTSIGGPTGTLTISNSATATFQDMTILLGGATSGTLNIQNGATATAHDLFFGPSNSNSGSSANINISGAGSVLTCNTSNPLNIGRSSGSTGNMILSSSGVFNSGTGLITINTTGLVTLNGGTFNANADVNVAGGSITRNSGNFNLASGRTLTATSGAQINLGDFLSLPGGTTWNIQSGADLFTTSFIDIGDSGGVTTVTIDGSGSTLATPSTSIWGTGGNTAQVTFRNGASANVGGILLAFSPVAGTAGTASVESGATMTVPGQLNVATQGGATTTGTVTVTGAGSTLTQTGANVLTVGHASTGTATLNVLSSGTFSTGTGLITVKATGNVHIGAGSTDGTFNANGDVNVAGGLITRTSGSFNLASGRTLTATSGGQINLGGATALSDGTTWNIQSGADLFGSSSIDIGLSGGVTSLTMDGAGSTLTIGSATSQWGSAGNTAQVTVRNAALGNVGGIDLANSSTAGTNGTISVQSGATLSTAALNVAANGGTTTAGTVTVTGSGSTITQTGSSALTLGHTSTGTGTLNVLDAGTFTAGTGGTILRATGTINIDGGFANLGPLDAQGGTVSFVAGSLNYIGNLTIGTGGLLGTNLTMPATKQLTLNGATTINPFRTLILDGGRFSTGTLVVQSGGILDFQQGTLVITGAGGLTINAAGPLGSSMQVVSGAVLEVSNGLHNEGLISGNGTVVAALDNRSAGEIRADAGQTLFFNGSGHTNQGNVRLVGGRAEFGGIFTNQPSGQIVGRGTLITGGTGLVNNGTIAFSGGLTDVFGYVNNATGSATKGITISGNAGVTFWDDVTNGAGSLFKASANSSTTFFGTFAGGGISGSGNVYFESDISPGFSPASIIFGGNVALSSTASLEIEIGGTTAGTQFDQVHVTGALALDGNLDVSLTGGFMPTVGQSFDVLDWDSLSGTFGTFDLDPISSTLTWNTSQLYTDGVLYVVPALTGDYNANGTVDAADYVVWRKTLGSTTNLAADGNGNHQIDAGDLTIWRAHYGQTAGSGAGINANSTVPEPPIVELLLIGFLATCCIRRTGVS